MAKDAIRHAQIRALAQQIHNVPARHAQHKTKQRGDQHPDGQNVQRRVGLGRDHPVVDLHGKNDPRKRQHVDKQRGEHDPAVGAQIAHHQPVEPVRAIFRDIGIHPAVLQGGQGTQGDHMADGREHGRHRQAVGVRVAVEKADLKRVLAVEMFNDADFPLAQLHHDGQTPAIDRLPICRQQLK